ncbi:MAG: MFS transporter, partial [Clostridia bacterium]|nr:MFS transporter [Clostridia bacterium]
YVARVTAANPSPLIFFVLLLLVVLVSMGTFRSPAVALMPDVTLKPLRSKGNAIINLMGAVGGVLVLLLGIVFGTGKAQNALMSYTTFFLIIAAMMLLALFVFCRFVKEPLWAKEMEEESERLGLNVEEEPAEATAPARRLSKTEKTSLLLILASVALWYIGYNAVTTKYSVYAESVLNMDYNTTLLIAQAAAIISYLPVGMVASRIGRKKTILAGVVMLTVAFAGAYFVVPGVSPVLMTAFFALAGIAWATINVNSFPMVVELAKGGDVGKYTGFYYTASMSAQIVTPVLSGFLMDAFGMRNVLFPYAAIACALAFVTMFFVRHGDSRPVAKKGLEALDADD